MLHNFNFREVFSGFDSNYTHQGNVSCTEAPLPRNGLDFKRLLVSLFSSPRENKWHVLELSKLNTCALTYFIKYVLLLVPL